MMQKLVMFQRLCYRNVVAVCTPRVHTEAKYYVVKERRALALYYACRPRREK